jgi:hypothetical protein
MIRAMIHGESHSEMMMSHRESHRVMIHGESHREMIHREMMMSHRVMIHRGATRRGTA